MDEITITPTVELVVLQVHADALVRRGHGRTRVTLRRWLERGARRKRRHINEPSLFMETEYDPATRKTRLAGSADSFPDTMPDWLRTTKVTS